MSQTDHDQERHLQKLIESIGRLILKGETSLKGFRDEVLGDLEKRLEIIAKSVGEEGIDPFGMDPEALRRVAIGAAFLYKIYFRCLARGYEHVPEGPVILVANHGGQLPIDAVMITTALLIEGDPPRLVRSMMHHWVPSMPFVSSFFPKVGVALGATENAERLLDRGEVLLTFPEGMKAISKTVDQAYRLQRFGLGFMRLALTAKTPIVPIAVVGSEEQYPTLYNLKGVGKLLGLPSLPIWLQMVIPLLGMLPLPVRYRLHFGEPMRFDGDPDDEDAAVREMADQVRDRLKGMIDTLRAERKSVFW